MILQKSPNGWSCLPTAFAMAINLPVQELITKLGHDGSEIVWPDLVEPMRRRGFHTQEIIQLLLNTCAVTRIEKCPKLAPTLEAVPVSILSEFDRLIHKTRGVLTGRTDRCGHAVAYDHGIVCDPRGTTYRYGRPRGGNYQYNLPSVDFEPICLWIINPVKSNPECNTIMP